MRGSRTSSTPSGRRELTAAIGLFGRYQAGLALPFTLYLSGDEIDAMGMPIPYRLTESGIGDLRIEGKALIATLGEDDEYTVAVSGWPVAADGQERRPPLPGRQDRHRSDQGDRRRRLRQGARRRQPRHPAARDLAELQDRAGSPAAVRRRGRLPGRAPRRPDAGGVRAQRPDPVHQLLLGRQPVRGGHRRPLHASTACGR